MDEPSIIMAGNLSEGYVPIGPFPDFHSAAAYAEALDLECWIMMLSDPKKVAEEEGIVP